MTKWDGSSGKKAENVAAEFLKSIGYKIIDRNWQRPDCEIDIVARKLRTETISFFEVKYRKSFSQGDGLDYVTSEKLKQLVYASNRYLSSNNIYLGYSLGVVTVYGEDFRIDKFIESIDL